MRRTLKAALTLAATVSTVAAVAAVATAGPASAKPYPPPSIHLLCSAAANGGTPEGGVCVLPSGQTTAPNNYSATIAVSKAGAAGPTVTFALTAGSLPPGLTMPAQSGSGTVITGNPAQTGTFNFTVKATDGNLTSTLAYQITITVQGPPDQLLCNSAGDFLESGVCVLPDAITGQPYAGKLVTSHNVGGTLSIATGALPAGLSLPATFTGSGATISGTPAAPGIEPTSSFTVKGTDTQTQPLYQPYQITVDPNQPLTVVLPASGSTLYPGTVGQAFGINFFLSGGAAPYTWALVAGALPPGMQLQTFSDPRDASNEMAGTPTTAGTFSWTMRVTDFYGHQASQKFTITIQP
jgi:large repetitive protein